MKKLDEKLKVKLIYSGELLIFAVVFLVLGILEIIRVINISENYHNIFNWVTLFGGAWLVIDLLWALFSKKRKQKVCILDKFLTAPLGIYLIVYDLISIINGYSVETNYEFFQYGMSSTFLYIALIYGFQGVYHYFYPIPGLFDEIEKKNDEPSNGSDIPNESTQIEETPSNEEKQSED